MSSKKGNVIMEEFIQSLKDFAMSGWKDLLLSALVLAAGFKLSGWIVNIISKGKAFSKSDPIFQSFMKNFVGIILKGVTIITCAGIMGVPMASIIAVISSVGLAIGLALQGSLSNFTGGLMILLFKPFRIGNYIECGTSGGTVKDISVFYTTLETPDKKVITVPNSTVSNVAVINYSVSPTRRLDISFQLDSTTSPETIRNVMLRAAQTDERTLNEPAPQVIITAVSRFVVTYTLRLWCLKEDYWDVLYDLTEKVKKGLDVADLSKAIPKTDANKNI